MPTITPPEPVTALCLLYPIIWPNGRTIYRSETSRRYSANDMPVLRDAANRPMTLTEEASIGSIVLLAIGDDGLLRTVQIMQATYTCSLHRSLRRPT